MVCGRGKSLGGCFQDETFVSLRKYAVDLPQEAGIQMVMKPKFVVYRRVSTARQGESGLGLDAQTEAVNRYLHSSGGEVVKEFTEIESGKKSDRPVLLEAIQLCKEHGYTLLVAKLDRLSRNLFFITTLQQSKVNFVAADNPHATTFVIHILVAVAEHERTLISQRTKAALDAAKRRGVRLGNPRYKETITKAIQARQELAQKRNSQLREIIAETMAKTGLKTLAEVANCLNLRGIKTNRGCQFTPTHIHRLMKAA